MTGTEITRNLDAEVLAASHGDEDAFSALWYALNPPLLRYLQVRNPKLAEDTAAETWLAVVGGIERFTGDERAFRSWLFTIARSKVVDEARRRSRRPVDLIDDWAGIEPVDPADVAGLAVETMQTADILALLRTLPGDQAEIVALRVLADLDVKAVAKIVGKSTGAVRVAQHRALQKLAALVEAGAGAGVTP